MKNYNRTRRVGASHLISERKVQPDDKLLILDIAATRVQLSIDLLELLGHLNRGTLAAVYGVNK